MQSHERIFADRVPTGSQRAVGAVFVSPALHSLLRNSINVGFVTRARLQPGCKCRKKCAGFTGCGKTRSCGRPGIHPRHKARRIRACSALATSNWPKTVLSGAFRNSLFSAGKSARNSPSAPLSRCEKPNCHQKTFIRLPCHQDQCGNRSRALPL